MLLTHPRADSVKIIECGDIANCGRPHIVLYDADDRIIADAVLSERWWPRIRDKIEAIFNERTHRDTTPPTT